MAPFQMASPFGLTTPIFNYKYKPSREALLAIAAAGKPDPHRGHALRYTNPIDGGWAMPTIATWLWNLPQGFETKPLRSTDGQTVIVVEGEIEVEAGDKTFRAGESDVISMPSWTWRKYRASKDAILFTFSDRSAQEKLGLFREELR